MPVTECGCWVWLGATYRSGHGQMTFKRQHLAVHRAAWMVYIGNIPIGKHVLHRCNVASCINPDHLYIGTDLENARDRIKSGTQHIPPRLIGENHNQAILDDNKVRMIRSSSRTRKQLAVEFGVSIQTIHAVKSRRLWKHVAP